MTRAKKRERIYKMIIIKKINNVKIQEDILIMVEGMSNILKKLWINRDMEIKTINESKEATQ